MKLALAIILTLCSLPAMAQDQGESTLLLVTGGGPTITYTSANCVGSATAAAASCTLAASASAGDLLVITSKTETPSSNDAQATLTFSGTASCASATEVIVPGNAVWQVNGSGGHFMPVEFACIVTTSGATTPVVTWAGTAPDGAFTDIAVAAYHTTTSWKASFVDQTATSVATTSTTGCPTGTTAATANPNDLVVAVCDTFNVGETWGTLSGFTNQASSSRNTTGWYDTTVSAIGTQSATIPLSGADYGVGMIAAFESN